MERAHDQIITDPILNEMAKNIEEAMKILENGQREVEERQKYILKDIPGPLQGCGQDVSSILQLIQNLMYGEEKEDSQRMHGLGERGHVTLLGHSLVAYISGLHRERVRRLSIRVQSDTTLWLCRIFRYENGSAYYHDDDREGLLRVCRLVLYSRYEDYATEGYAVLSCRHPVIYQSSACRPGLGHYLCSQLGLALSSLCTVPSSTTFGSEHQMDVSVLDRLIKDDVKSGKVPLLLIANAGTAGAGHTDKLGNLRELCDQHNMWLHVEGVNLATLALSCVTSSVLAATRCDSMTLTLGPWLGLPAVPAVTLYRHEDPALALATGLASTQVAEKLRALPLWMSLQNLGHDRIVKRIKHALRLSERLLEHLKKMTSIKTPVEDEVNSPIVLFKFSQETSPESPESNGDSLDEYSEGEIEFQDTLNRWLGEQLAQQVPSSGVDLVHLEDEGSCVRFNPLMTSALLGTQDGDVDALMERIGEMVPLLSLTMCLRHEFREEVSNHSNLTYVEDLNWPGLGGIRYNPTCKDPDESKRQLLQEKINGDLLKNLQQLETEVEFSTGPEFSPEKSCIFIGMATENLDVAKLVDAIAAMGRDIEEGSKLLDNMTETVQRGIQEAERQLQKANEEKIMKEGVLRQIPVVGSVLNWFSPVQSSVNGKTFNLVAGSLDSTESIYSMKTQPVKETDLTPVFNITKQSDGKKLFHRSPASSESLSVASSVSQPGDVETVHFQVPVAQVYSTETTEDLPSRPCRPSHSSEDSLAEEVEN
ncbi:pyridoxal-dependent decarboxylase domain-containing protein 1-like isoform X2 [Scleropages formosus]|uniref:Pyridoxal-dependent decarboxylase domain-containing protein 1 n=1 Tax=Scleropages formosus TaxID=113540 RepID=A0A8C9WBG2_SCLFO|nr:pyridoxal-dependent decarboxylase domain-containing protein 1-like isoform X2 [Scleropages formosus]